MRQILPILRRGQAMHFAGWYTDEALTQSYVQTTMPAHDLTLYAKWEAGMKTYQVRHYQQSIGNSEQYDLAETEKCHS